MDEATRKALVELNLALGALEDAHANRGRSDEEREKHFTALGRAQARIDLAIFRLTGRFPARSEAFAPAVVGMLERGEAHLP